ncbi:alpha-hydroxy acid oxidase [Euzebya pacifica]|uniref:alpha-hydroxy acid oxidase n=1 Tax=Euzebya pacifica TaxID=1608957 RepID=UPI0030FBFBEB
MSPEDIRPRRHPAPAEAATIGEIIAHARAVLPPERWDYASGGAGDEAALRRNRHALEAIGLVPRVLVDVSERRTATTFAGLPLAAPVMVAPIGGISLLHPDGAVGVARAANVTGTSAWISTTASPDLATVMRAAEVPLGFQLYVNGTRADAEALVRRALDLGYAAVCLTVDTNVSARRERDLRNGFRPGERRTPNTAAPGPVGMRDALSWDLLGWLRELTDGVPLVLKGVLDARDAVLAVDAGVDAIIVSNHGGRQLAAAPSPIEVLPDIVDAVGGRLQIGMDGGITSGMDALRALALGADAVLVGKLACWALAAGGGAVLARALTLLMEELRGGMGLLGVTTAEGARHARVVTGPTGGSAPW